MKLSLYKFTKYGFLFTGFIYKSDCGYDGWLFHEMKCESKNGLH